MARISVGKTGELAAGDSRVIEADGRSLALFNVDGTYYALDNSCPHRGGPLGEGDLDGVTIGCPWHGWRWNVTDGANVNNPAVRVACFPVVVSQGEIIVELP